MTDAELLELVQDKRPGELRPEELQLLRWRMEESPALQQALGERLAEEDQLAAVLAQVEQTLQLPGITPQPARLSTRQWAHIAVLGGVSLFVVWVVSYAAFSARAAHSPNRALVTRLALEQPLPLPHSPVREPTSAATAATTEAPKTAPEKLPGESAVASAPAKIKAPPELTSAKPAEKPAIALMANESAAAAPAKKFPWDDALAGEPRPFRDGCFQDFDTTKSLLSHEELRKWLTQVPGQRLDFHPQQGRLGWCSGFEGTARFVAPFTADSVLRFSLENYERLRLHFFAGAEGASFAYYEHRNLTWAAYTTARKPDAFAPERLALCGSDDGRWRRTEMRYGGAFEIRWRAGEMVLSRGDIVIMRAPLAAPPSDVFLEGRATVYGLAAARDKEFPPAELPPQPTVEFPKPVELAFSTTVPEGVKLEPSPAGAIALVGDKSKQAAAVVAPLPNVGPCELVVRLDEFAPGTGVFLAGPDKQPQIAARFLKDQRSGFLSLQLRGLDDGLIQDMPPWRETPVPYLSAPLWIRFTYGAGLLRVAVSPNGRHWGEAVDPQRGVLRNVTNLGLFFPGNGASGTIRLGYVSLRKLSHLSTPESDRLFPQAPEIIDVPTPGIWLTAVSQAQPADADTNAWRRAAALKSLGRGAPIGLGQPLLEMLLDDNTVRQFPAREQLLVLADAAQLIDTADDRLAQRFLERYTRAGERAASTGEQRPFSLVWPAAIQAPVAPQILLRAALEPLLRGEIVQLAFAQRDDDLAQLTKQMKFFHWNEDTPLVDWAEFLSGRRVEGPRMGSFKPTVGQRDEWPPAVVENIDKETFNAQSELQAVLESETPDDAVRTLSNFDPLAVSGLAPSAHDRQLYLSLGTSVASALRENAKLSEAMSRLLGDTAQRRIEQAIRAGNEQGVRLAALQFSATPAVAQAYSWLGDRALVAGNFAAALSDYRHANAIAKPAATPNLLARERYAAAWLGQSVGQPPVANVSLGEVTLSTADFETLVKEARTRAGAVGDSASPSSMPPPALRPTGFRVERRGKLDAEFGERANDVPGNFVQSNTSPWERQISVAVDGGVAYVSTRFQVLAFDLAGGKIKWRSPAPPQKAYAYDWAFIPQRPLVTPAFIYCRFLMPQGPVLGCLDKNNGTGVWSFVPPSNGCVVSDPVLVGGEIVVLTVSQPEQRERALRLTRLDARTGEVLRAHDWLRLSEAWNTRHVAQVAVHEELLFATLGGATVCGDLSTGQVRWLRRSVAVPADVDAASLSQAHEPPLVYEGKLFVAQPRVPAVECLEPETGKLVWRTVLPALRGIIGCAGPILIARTGDGAVALDRVTGAEKWRFTARDLQAATLCGGEGQLMLVRKEPLEGGGANCPQLVWLNLASGKPAASVNLTSLANDGPSLGPLWRSGDRIWGLFGRVNDVNREFVELTPQGEAKKAAVTVSSLAGGNEQSLEQIRAAVAALNTEWEVLNAGGGPGAGLRGEFQGEKDVAVAYAAPPQELALGRFGSAPTGNAKLALKLGAAKDQPWKLAVSFGNKTLLEKEFDGKDGGHLWQEIEVDLKPAAGQKGWLIVRAWHTSGGNDRVIAVKRLEIRP